jgi:phosphoribosyl-AMP cyclohydrolase
MFAHMNADALARTIETGEVWFYSRSRATLWRKGESSGHTLRVDEIRVDCDQDALWIKAQPQGPGACHTGRRSCFYRVVQLHSPAGPTTGLEFRDGERVFDPDAVYRRKPKG